MDTEALQLEAASALVKRLPGLSVFVPVWNEEGNLERVVTELARAAAEVTDNYEIIIVNDGSQDRTGEIASELAARDQHIRVVHHPVNQGYGAAVTSGIRASRMPYVMLCDGDGQFDAADMKLLICRIADYDVVVGRRKNRVEGFVRRLNGWAWSSLMRLLFGVESHDVDCGFKLFRREFLEGLQLKSRGAMISAELLAKLAGRGARVCEVDVRHLPRLTGKPTGASPRVIARAFVELFALARELRAESAKRRRQL